MGYLVSVTLDAQAEVWVVTVKADLSRAETNQLFLSGDSMVSWPVDGLSQDKDPGLERSSMFVSEIAARPQGLTIRYRKQADAERAVAILRVQLSRIGIQEVG